MDTNLEEKRSLHEERDRIEVAIVNEMLAKKNGHRNELDSEHRQKVLLDRYRKCSKNLLNLYASNGKAGDEKREPTITMRNDSQKIFDQFYQAIHKVREFYSINANEQVVTMASEFDEIEAARLIALGLKPNSKSYQPDQDDEELEGSECSEPNEDDDAALARRGEKIRLSRGLPTTDLIEVVDEPPAPTTLIGVKSENLVEFTDEEGYGRYIDLNKCHTAFLQVLKKEDTKPNYLTFLDKFDRFTDLPRQLKLTLAYKIYIEEMLNYFRDFSKRARPLLEFEELEKEVHVKFVEQWNSRLVNGWFDESDRAKVAAEPMVDLESYKSCDQLMDLGLDCLKKELQARGLKCGGTLEERAKRLWSVRGKSPDDISESLKVGPSSNSKSKIKKSIDPFYIASIEAKLTMYVDYFNDHRLATIENVQRKQARTADERNESDEDISDTNEEESEQTDVVYNPKNLPLDYNGKPIPYWLYKLHNLDKTFTCEICGNATYKGPKAFERHFAEWRHANGMRSLKIPNTAHFANITKIQDAISLWDKLKNEKQKDKFQPLVEEEFEDSQGNVVNRKTYEDLKRQGLL